MLSFLHQLLSAFFVHLSEHLVTSLVICILRDWDGWLFRFNDQRILSLFGKAWVIAVHRPVTRLNCQLLLLKTLCHIITVCDTVTISDDKRRAIIGFGFQQST